MLDEDVLGKSIQCEVKKRKNNRQHVIKAFRVKVQRTQLIPLNISRINKGLSEYST